MDKYELWEKGRQIVLGAPQLYVDVDVEADGIAGHGSMLSIGAQSPTGESFYSEIKPYSEDYLKGHRDFCERHGMQRDRLLREAPDVLIAINGLKDFVENLRETYQKQPILTAFNASFDYAHIDLAFAKANIDPNPFGIAPFDLKSLATPLGENWDYMQTKKSRLPAEIIPEGDFTHHALEDAQYQQKLHFGMAALLSANYLKTIGS